MKKILLTAAIVAVSSSSALATVTAEKGCWYAKANAGVAKLQKNSGYKTKTDGLATIAVGYNIMDNLRADLSLDHFFDPKFTLENATVKNTLKLDMNSLLVNVYADLVDASMAKVFVGAGVGVARVSGKFTNMIKAQPDASPAIEASTVEHKIKSNKEFSYALYAGVSSEVDHGIFAELTYAYKDFGKHTSYTVTDTTVTPNTVTTLKVLNKRLASHQVTLGMRFDI
ncbi:MAG: porin family protein [Rickettsiaceae bacterium]|nr:porin family protein [Rickettsiaceae bacterium]